jgi:hypothetical protein
MNEGDEINYHMMARTCSTHDADNKFIKDFEREMKESTSTFKVMLRRTFEKKELLCVLEIGWLRMRFSCGFLLKYCVS